MNSRESKNSIAEVYGAGGFKYTFFISTKLENFFYALDGSNPKNTIRSNICYKNSYIIDNFFLRRAGEN